MNPNQISIETNVVDKNEITLQADNHILDSANKLKPPYTEHCGSVVMHFFKPVYSLEPKPVIVVQSVKMTAPEEVVQAGFVTLRNRLMELFGHKAPAKRKV